LDHSVNTDAGAGESKNSSGHEIANVNCYPGAPGATRIRWNNAI